jgi:hypothetical protein
MINCVLCFLRLQLYSKMINCIVPVLVTQQHCYDAQMLRVTGWRAPRRFYKKNGENVGKMRKMMEFAAATLDVIDPLVFWLD